MFVGVGFYGSYFDMHHNILASGSFIVSFISRKVVVTQMSINFCNII